MRALDLSVKGSLTFLHQTKPSHRWPLHRPALCSEVILPVTVSLSSGAGDPHPPQAPSACPSKVGVQGWPIHGLERKKELWEVFYALLRVRNLFWTPISASFYSHPPGGVLGVTHPWLPIEMRGLSSDHLPVHMSPKRDCLLLLQLINEKGGKGIWEGSFLFLVLCPGAMEVFKIKIYWKFVCLFRKRRTMRYCLAVVRERKKKPTKS